MNDRIPIASRHRGVGIEASQSPARVAVVRDAIDAVHALADPVALAAVAADISRPPEARLLAAAKAEAAWERATEERRERPPIDLEAVRASVAGLGSLGWQDPDRYGSLLDVERPGAPRMVRR